MCGIYNPSDGDTETDRFLELIGLVLAKPMISRFNERPWLKNKVDRNQGRYQTVDYHIYTHELKPLGLQHLLGGVWWLWGRVVSALREDAGHYKDTDERSSGKIPSEATSKLSPDELIIVSYVKKGLENFALEETETDKQKNQSWFL